MSLQASKLKLNDVQKKHVHRITRSIVNMIDEKIKEAHSAGLRDSVSVNIPNLFDVPNMKNKDAQRKIYACIIENLKSREFDVELELCDSCTIVNVSWLSKEERAEINYELNLIAKHILKNNASE